MNQHAIFVGGRRHRGAATIVVVMLLVVLVVTMLTAANDMASTGVIGTVMQESAADALLVAESGIERGLRRFSDNTSLCSANGLGEVNVELVAGSGRRFSIVSDDTGLPANQCMLTVTGEVATANASRTVQALVQTGGAGGGIALDVVSSRTRNDSSGVSWNLAISGTDRLLVVAIAVRGTASITGVTVHGTPLVFKRRQLSPNPDTYVEIWYQINPKLGNNVVQISLSAKANVVAGAMNFTGVDQAQAIQTASAGVSGGGASPAITISTVDNNAWVFAALAARTGSVPVAGAGHAQQWNEAAGKNASVMVRGTGSTSGPVTPVGSVNIGWTLPAVPWAMLAISIIPAAAGAPGITAWTELSP